MDRQVAARATSFLGALLADLAKRVDDRADDLVLQAVEPHLRGYPAVHRILVAQPRKMLGNCGLRKAGQLDKLAYRNFTLDRKSVV